MVDTEQKILAIVSHIGYLVGGIPFVFLPLIIYLWKKSDPFVAYHAKQALVAQSLVGILCIVTSALTSILIGVLLWPVLGLIGIMFFVLSFIAAWAAFNSRYFEYPFIQNIVDRF